VITGLTVLASSTALTGCSPGSVELGPVNATGATEQVCRDFLDALPTAVAGEEGREVTPSDALGAAWGDPAIVVECGVEEPEGIGPVPACLTVNGVDWYLPEDQVAPPGEEQGTVTIWTLNREATVSLELPGEYWPPATALADLTDSVEEIPATGRCR